MMDKKRFQAFLDLVADACCEDGWDMPEGMFGVAFVPFFGAYHVSYQDKGLAAPLNTDIWLTRIPIHLDEAGAKVVADGLALLVGDDGAIVGKFEERRAKVSALLSGSGATLVGMRIGSVTHAHGRIESTAIANVLLLDEGMAENILSYVIDDDSKTSRGWRDLARAVKAQPSRRARAGKTLCADPITIAALSVLEPARRAALVAFVSNQPRPTTGLVGQGGPRDRWTPAQLRRLGHAVPDEIEAIRIKEGRLVARVRLGRHATWNDGAISISRSQLPEVTVGSLAGRDVKDVLEHPALSGLGAITGASQGRGVLRIKVGVPSLPIPA